MLRPNSSVKFLNVAIWFSDELERVGKTREAYKVLCDAIHIYRSRYQRHSDNKSTAALDSDELVERRFLISVFSKLASLSENCEPTAEGKWLSSAVCEMIPLLPVRQGPWEEVYGIIEQFATVDPSFFGVSSCLQSHSNLPTGPTNSQQTEEDSTANLEVSEREHSGQNSFRIKFLRLGKRVLPQVEVTPEDDYLSLPFWCASDVPSAIAIPLKHIGIFAEKHRHFGLAYNAYKFAILISSLRGTEKSDSRLQGWEYGFRALEYRNYRTDFLFRHLDIASNPDDWRYLEHYSVPPVILQSLKRVYEIEKKIAWMARVASVEKLLRTYGETLALAAKHKAIFLEKVGSLDEALKEFQSSIELWGLSKRPTSNQEIRDIQGRIERVKRRIAEGDTSVDDQLHPDILMSWKRVKKRALEAKRSKDGGAAT
ncbi:hypothetical protein A7U60_g5561 [Sanghuangporus baumii]|uniref:Uncharacterized protein n=1 Tax=Sanghuangporus baumii TaxID=108892 RepID=A0A9Q5N819_SANBA|nr:hypothetical protein A7U60_g5561 [Sanghuangporus baumii]